MDRAAPAAALYVSSVLFTGGKVWAAPISKLFVRSACFQFSEQG